jgi:hypothetical protein
MNPSTEPRPLRSALDRPLPRLDAPRLPLLPELDWEGFEGDLEQVLKIVDALWGDSRPAGDSALARALELATLKEYSTERILEQSLRGLLNQALREGPALAAHRVQEPFFRLPVFSRFLLAALHAAHFDYGRLTRLLFEEDSTERRIELQKLAWSARLELALSSGFQQGQLAVPTGSGNLSVGNTHCPEFLSTHPWTQAFLDDEAPTPTRTFLQNHLMACEGCRTTLERSRKLYYSVEAAVEAAIPGGIDFGAGPRHEKAEATSARKQREIRARALGRLVTQTTRLRAPVRRSFQESVGTFLDRRREAWLAMALVVFSVVYIVASLLGRLLGRLLS